MKRSCAWLILTTILLLGVPSSGGAILGSITLGTFLAELEESVQSIVDYAQNAADNVVNNSVYNLLNTTSQLREQYDDILDTTIDQLTEQQQQLFEGLATRIDQVLTGIDDEHDRIDDTLDNLAIYLSDFVFVDDIPRISRFLTSTTVHGRLADIPLMIRFKGKNLNNQDNRLFVSTVDGGLELEPIELSDNQISFALSQEQVDGLSSPDKISFIPIELSLFADAILLSDKERKYRYLVRVLPKELTRVVFHYSEIVPVVSERTERTVEGPTGSFQSRLFSSNKRSVSMTQPVDAGYKIDHSTVSVSWEGSNGCWVARSRCSARASDDVASANCTIVSENSTRGMSGCSFSVTLRFTQYKVIDQLRYHKTEPMIVSYGAPVAWNIPAGKRFDRLEAILFDGTTVIYDRSTQTSVIRVVLGYPFNRSWCSRWRRWTSLPAGTVVQAWFGSEGLSGLPGVAAVAGFSCPAC